MRIIPFQDKDAKRWDQFCLNSHNATFLHTRKFVSYHGERFIDRSLIIEDEKNNINALFLAAQSSENKKIVISHPGLTYGGLIVGGSVYGDKTISVMENIQKHYCNEGYHWLLYKVVPYFYQKIPSQDDLYALFRTGASRYRCDISATIDLSRRGVVSSRRRRSLKKAFKNTIKVERGVNHIDGVWTVLLANLARKHDASPVHLLDEILMLAERFPDNIEILAGYAEDEVIAGLVLFQTDTVSHAQYIAASEAGYQTCALDLLFETAIDGATEKGMRYFDFGISNENDGQILNQSLYQFKREFGAGGAVHEYYEIDLKRLANAT